MLISEEYRNLNERLHQDNISYGMSGMNYANEVYAMCDRFNTEDVLDYGCGKDTLARNLPFNINRYDPAIKRFSEPPKPADFVVCTDVLEHIEPHCLDDVLADIRRVMKKFGYLVIHTGPAKKTLQDGRNAHLIIEDYSWWYDKLSEYFEIDDSKTGMGATFYVRPRDKIKKVNKIEPHII
jgi:hypothetical protein